MLWNSEYKLTIENDISIDAKNMAITRYSSGIGNSTVDHNLVYGAYGIMADTAGARLGGDAEC